MNILRVKEDRSGIVFVTVLVIIIVMMIATVSIISMNVSQVQVTEKEVKRIQAEMMSQGALNLYHAAKQMDETTTSLSPWNETMGSTSNPFPVSVVVSGVGTCSNNTDCLTVKVNY